MGKVANAASESVVVELLKTKCLPILYYGLDACPITKRQYKSLNYVLYSSFRKIFNINCQQDCIVYMSVFKCLSVEESVFKRKCKFLSNYVTSDNILCCACQGYAYCDIDAIMARA